MLESRDDAVRPAPVDTEWETHAIDGVVGVRIATAECEDPSSEWIWSSQWLDLVAKR